MKRIKREDLKVGDRYTFQSVWDCFWTVVATFEVEGRKAIVTADYKREIEDCEGNTEAINEFSFLDEFNPEYEFVYIVA